MKKLEFSIEIAAPRERVWQILWDDATYRQWTKAFHEGSYAESDWKEGSKIFFLSPERDGMSSRIARLIPNEFMSFEHLGEVRKGVEDFTAAREKGWAGSFENYTLTQNGGKTMLKVDLDADEEYSGMFEGMFPKALAIVKELAEQK